ncbi:hypothetical protein BmR1_04g08800 [Babesia microti strain RI]|uniref:Uncharacterized protein n=1 Tax=Babesia microti (strain RI) TaxID=1133968 RepID=I7IHJ8_BABMR|nr:hypothetical protein BmR1_04g08800 [Babesia microti strain RI]CCF75937.1 hypothetical protein BmR1_04g08800 [Babesia microti strain RI]|eukprot:XP_012650345.1 hypothetical protein BmR1_04g08800 [Babesia microti strain RI]
MNTHCSNCNKFHEFIRGFDLIYGKHIKDLEDSLSLNEIFKRVLDNILMISGDNFGANHPITELFKFLVLLRTHSYNDYHEREPIQKSNNNDELIKNLEKDLKFYKDKYEVIKNQLWEFEKQIELIGKLDRVIYGRIGKKLNTGSLRN